MSMTKFETGNFTKDDCLKDNEFTPEFLEFLKKDGFIGQMYLRGMIKQSKEDFVDSLLKLKKADDVDSFIEYMKPYIERFEDVTGYKCEEKDWRHCNDISLLRSTLKFTRGDSMCLLCVFEDRFDGAVNADVFVKDGTFGMRHWNHIDHCGVRSKLDDYFDRIIAFCKRG